jgi:hypothetical protein
VDNPHIQSNAVRRANTTHERPLTEERPRGNEVKRKEAHAQERRKRGVPPLTNVAHQAQFAIWLYDFLVV